MPTNRILILSAVDLEARAIAGALHLRRESGRRVWRGANSSAVELHVVGVRALHLPKIDNHPPVDWVIVAGLAGGLDPKIASGELVLNGAPAGFHPRTPFRIGKIHTASSIVSTPAEKAALFHSTGALAVDMESATLRPLAEALGAGFIDVRVVLDAADESLSSDLARLVDPFGKANPWAIATHLLRHPPDIGKLLQIGRSTQSVLKNLGAAVSDLVGFLGRETDGDD